MGGQSNIQAAATTEEQRGGNDGLAIARKLHSIGVGCFVLTTANTNRAKKDKSFGFRRQVRGVLLHHHYRLAQVQRGLRDKSNYGLIASFVSRHLFLDLFSSPLGIEPRLPGSSPACSVLLLNAYRATTTT